jgi:UDP-2,3-diacylglucosamine pyrophosphatase LpxH
MACSTATALQHGIHLLVEAVDMARQVAKEVVIVPIHGNHDRTNGVAAAMAAGQRFHSTRQVEMMGLSERQYATYGQHLMMMTHGDLAKKKMRKIGEIMRSEARELYGRTEWSGVFTGHYHFKAMDMIDESGRIIYQTPSPVPVDSYHNQEGYVGSRKAVQLVLLDREDGGDRMIHA